MVRLVDVVRFLQASFNLRTVCRICKDNPVLLEDPVLNAIADKLGRTLAQVAIRYLLQKGMVVLAKSFTPARIRQNLQVLDFQLSEDDMSCLDGRNKNVRYTSLLMWAEHPKYPFHDEY
ncbi:aldo-keto reductase family 1 [Pristimantis euphronides]